MATNVRMIVSPLAAENQRLKAENKALRDELAILRGQSAPELVAAARAAVAPQLGGGRAVHRNPDGSSVVLMPAPPRRINPAIGSQGGGVLDPDVISQHTNGDGSSVVIRAAPPRPGAVVRPADALLPAPERPGQTVRPPGVVIDVAPAPTPAADASAERFALLELDDRNAPPTAPVRSSARLSDDDVGRPTARPSSIFERRVPRNHDADGGDR